ncbi:Hypothetical protein LUCI_4417 [Lucifera butyrica]|uniref:Uncharacterized protein n=1 Tax=Lucifera butyrica TaxID=1351585 RepID=A0A498RCJ0_9FIRM|nr:hypothetical protein [Lucifera butyrica]VBB09131.1 Hypothetical protein LUCI_4417 [Lucifera butyrica]
MQETELTPCIDYNCDGEMTVTRKEWEESGELFMQNIYTCTKCGRVHTGSLIRKKKPSIAN